MSTYILPHFMWGLLYKNLLLMPYFYWHFHVCVTYICNCNPCYLQNIVTILNMENKVLSLIQLPYPWNTATSKCKGHY